MNRGEYDAMTNAIAHWIALNVRPNNIVTDDGLQDTLISDLYNREKSEIQQLHAW